LDIMAKFFDDIGKDSNDLLNKGFPSLGTYRVIAETKTDNGVSLTATGRRFVKDKVTSVDATFEPKVNWKARNVELSGSLNTSAEYTGTVTLKDLGAKGTELALSASSKGGEITTKDTVSYKDDNVATKTTATYSFKDKPIVVDASAVGAYEKRFFGGGNVNYTFAGSSKALLLWGVKAGVDQNDTQAHLFANSTEKNNLFVGAGLLHKISSALKLAANLTADAKNIVGPSATLGVENKFDDLTTLKTKVNVQTHTDGSKPTEARLGLGLKQSLNSNFSATVGLDVNVRQLLGTNAGADHSFGLDLKFL